jgi:glycosyltransferase involved in cell wall biosynthesis
MTAAERPAAGEPIKLLLVGPCPPPHGGISVHVATAHRLLARSGARCRLLDTGGHRRPGGGRGGRAGRAAAALLRLAARVRRGARDGWTLHLHTNGHNPKSWLVALACGLAARRSPGRVLTLHSGMVPEYLGTGRRWRRALARLALGPYGRVLCVNPEIREALAGLGVDRRRLGVLPAYLAPPAAEAGPALPLGDALERWLAARSPLLVTALFFRPEYGFEVLLEALARLAGRHPGLGCLVLGSGEGEAAARRLVAERGLGERLFLSGDVAHELCLAAMARADLFVRPTLVDGDALSVREALALGLPVVASDVGVRPPGAVLFPPGDAGALAAAVAAVLAAGRGEEPALHSPRAAIAPWDAVAPTPAGDGPGGIEALLRTYREVACAAR